MQLDRLDRHALRGDRGWLAFERDFRRRRVRLANGQLLAPHDKRLRGGVTDTCFVKYKITASVESTHCCATLFDRDFHGQRFGIDCVGAASGGPTI